MREEFTESGVWDFRTAIRRSSRAGQSSPLAEFSLDSNLDPVLRSGAAVGGLLSSTTFVSIAEILLDNNLYNLENLNNSRRRALDSNRRIYSSKTVDFPLLEFQDSKLLRLIRIAYFKALTIRSVDVEYIFKLLDGVIDGIGEHLMVYALRHASEQTVQMTDAKKEVNNHNWTHGPPMRMASRASTLPKRQMKQSGEMLRSLKIPQN
ncbi:hypothetical protein M5K25_006831 [Dendrobium thyrsiflorum]|uniref:Uncharacterized protein n=1 Tax=Dendrobium thyrsiflorum TaxID=117978 RepID=A0ABD0VCL9_DENTH